MDQKKLPIYFWAEGLAPLRALFIRVLLFIFFFSLNPSSAREQQMHALTNLHQLTLSLQFVSPSFSHVFGPYSLSEMKQNLKLNHSKFKYCYYHCFGEGISTGQFWGLQLRRCFFTNGATFFLCWNFLIVASTSLFAEKIKNTEID